MAKEKAKEQAVEKQTVNADEFIQRKLQVLNALGTEKANRSMQRIIEVNRQGGKA